MLAFLREQVEQHGVSLLLRIQVSSFEAVCRMVEADVGIGVIPESSALRHRQTMGIKIIALDEPWAVRERSILIRDLEGLPGCVHALVAAIKAHQGSGA